MSLLGRFSEPAQRLGMVERNTALVQVQEAKAKLGGRLSLRSRPAIPFHGLAMLRRCALRPRAVVAQECLRGRETLLGGFAQPVPCFAFVRSDPAPASQ